MVCRAVGQSIVLSDCLSGCLSVSLLAPFWGPGSLDLILGALRGSRGPFWDHLGYPGLDFEVSWAPFGGLWSLLGALGGSWGPQGLPVVAQRLIVASCWNHFG